MWASRARQRGWGGRSRGAADLGGGGWGARAARAGSRASGPWSGNEIVFLLIFFLLIVFVF